MSGPVFDAFVDFVERGEKTEVSMRAVFESAALRDKVAEQFGAVEGMHQTLERLGDIVAKSLVLTRTFDAPRALVFQAWTEPSHDGTLYPMPGRFHEVVEPERLVFSTSAMDGALEVLNTVTFEDAGDKTRMTLQAIVVKSTPDAAFALSGMREGWTQSLEKLDEELGRTFLISRTFDAPRDLVWKAWTETERLMQWFGPKGSTMFHATNDLRPGGVLLYALRMPDGVEVWGRWVYREVTPPERLVLVTSFSDAEGNITKHPMAPTWPAQTLSTTTFTERDGKTTVTINWRPLDATQEEIDTFKAGKPSMTQGWGGTLDQLADYLGRTA